jgi:hypothetical protein
MPTITPLHRRQEIYDWLNKRAELLGIKATLLTHRANISDNRLYLPVYIANSTDAYDDSVKLQELESSWNYQETEPHLRVFLLPADASEKPSWAESYAPVQQAIDRYHEAFDTFRAAASSEDMQKALKNMEEAKAAELEAAKQLDSAA